MLGQLLEANCNHDLPAYMMSDPKTVGLKKLIIDGDLTTYHIRGDQHAYVMRNATLTDTLSSRTLTVADLLILAYYDLPSSAVYNTATDAYKRCANVVFLKLLRLKKKVRGPPRPIPGWVDRIRSK